MKWDWFYRVSVSGDMAGSSNREGNTMSTETEEKWESIDVGLHRHPFEMCRLIKNVLKMMTNFSFKRHLIKSSSKSHHKECKMFLPSPNKLSSLIALGDR